VREVSDSDRRQWHAITTAAVSYRMAFQHGRYSIDPYPVTGMSTISLDGVPIFSVTTGGYVTTPAGTNVKQADLVRLVPLLKAAGIYSSTIADCWRRITNSADGVARLLAADETSAAMLATGEFDLSPPSKVRKDRAPTSIEELSNKLRRGMVSRDAALVFLRRLSDSGSKGSVLSTVEVAAELNTALPALTPRFIEYLNGSWSSSYISDGGMQYLMRAGIHPTAIKDGIARTRYAEYINANKGMRRRWTSAGSA